MLFPVIPLALTYEESATIFSELENSISNNDLGKIAKARTRVFRETLTASDDVEQCVLES